MLYASRDPDVLIYGLLVPLVLYPVIFIGSGEFAFWMVGQFEKHVAKVAVEFTPDRRYELVKNALAPLKQVKVVASASPDADLKAHKLDAVVDFDQEDKKRIYIKLSSANLVDKTGLLAFASILSMQRGYLDGEGKKAGIPKAQLEVFKARYVDVAPSTLRNQVVRVDELGGIPAGWMAFIVLIWVHIALCAGPPAAIMFAEEREKNTVETTLLLPPSRLVIVLGKFAATCGIALISGLMYLTGIALTFFALLIATGVKSERRMVMTDILTPHAISPETWVLFSITLILSTAACAAVYLLSTSYSKTFKEAQAILTIPILLFCALPMFSFLPGLELNAYTTMVPVLNLFLALKRGEPEILYTSISIAWMLAIIVFSLYFSGRSLNIDASRGSQ